jgi:quercetin dioxygenase-like cupin family protein
MKTDNIKNYIAGWIVGNFKKTLFSSEDVEVAIKHTPKDTSIERHYQKVATEYNYIVSGQVNANGVELSAGDIFTYAPGEITELEILEDTTIVVIKTPSLGYDDKVVCDE